jgi:23S rRNA (cytosine1962-C5)-methyltransferase
MKSPSVKLKLGREKPITLGHPWIFSGAIKSWSSTPEIGQPVDVISSSDEWLARGLASPNGNLAIRIYSRNEFEKLDDSFFANNLSDAIAWRERVVMPREDDTDSFRLCYSESDGISGLIVDRYADTACLHLNTLLLLPFVPSLVETLRQRGYKTVVQYDEDSFALEGRAKDRVAIGRDGSPNRPQAHALANRSESGPYPIKESGFNYHVDLTAGQKTGFYLDQRVNRRRVSAYAAGRRCLSAYCYTGGFETHLVRAGASSIVGLDRSESAITQAKINQSLNPDGTPVSYEVADVPEMLRKYRDTRTDFDLIILDPPKFVHKQGQLEKGLRAYKDINRLAMKLLTPGGILATFSCSGWVKREQFLTALSWAAADAGREIQILEQLAQPPDHPILLSFPESDYLCGFILRVK